MRGLINWKRVALLSAIVALPLAWAPLDAFAKNHAFLLNASPSLPHWAFWLDREVPIARGSLIFFEPAPSALVRRHFGARPQIFGKRVIGMPGDIVSHAGMDVFINGKKVATRIATTSLGIALARGPEGPIPDSCFYVGTDHPRGLDSRYGAIGLVCRGRILGSGKAIL
ncbi:S26 family signal peptidase [Erythrobacter sp. EC-HK427]|uniref:S26 family signal peptidase n=1 Tax=Erythrobacter sp. EC-HK427 TaxID=2038396 RepID=UPI001251BC99|nr:S26 family signal peptidase [Erythrobacter sp. EC-HK427]VVT00641.1 putative F pilus assembly protein traF [Erythrobacter sp. EC-HK427]